MLDAGHAGHRMDKRIAGIIRWLERCRSSYKSGAIESALMDAECARADLEDLRLDVWEHVSDHYVPKKFRWSFVLCAFFFLPALMVMATPSRISSRVSDLDLAIVNANASVTDNVASPIANANASAQVEVVAKSVQESSQKNVASVNANASAQVEVAAKSVQESSQKNVASVNANANVSAQVEVAAKSVQESSQKNIANASAQVKVVAKSVQESSQKNVASENANASAQVKVAVKPVQKSSQKNIANANASAAQTKSRASRADGGQVAKTTPKQEIPTYDTMIALFQTGQRALNAN